MSEWAAWYWPWPAAPTQPLRPADAAHNPALRAHFNFFLDNTEPPSSFKPLTVTELLTKAELAAMGYEKPEEALPAIYELAWELRAMGDCEILRKGVVLGDDVDIMDLDGPVRIRRIEL